MTFADSPDAIMARHATESRRAARQVLAAFLVAVPTHLAVLALAVRWPL